MISLSLEHRVLKFCDPQETVPPTSTTSAMEQLVRIKHKMILSQKQGDWEFVKGLYMSTPKIFFSKGGTNIDAFFLRDTSWIFPHAVKATMKLTRGANQTHALFPTVWDTNNETLRDDLACSAIGTEIEAHFRWDYDPHRTMLPNTEYSTSLTPKEDSRWQPVLLVRTTFEKHDEQMARHYAHYSNPPGLDFHGLEIECTITEEVPLPQTSLPSVGTLPSGTVLKMNQGQPKSRFLGFYHASHYGNAGAKPDIHVVVGPEKDTAASDLQSQKWSRSMSADDVPKQEQRFRVKSRCDRISTTLMKALHTNTIRGIRLYDCLSFVHCKRGTKVPVYVVGGAVRDAFLGKAPADVDLAVARTWNDLEHDIKDFFSSRGHALSDADYLLDKHRRHFGMMKICGIQGTDPDDLDVGLFKAGAWSFWRWKNALGAQSNFPRDVTVPPPSKKVPKYFFGYSLVQDAATRDFTVNALYFNPFDGEDGSLHNPTGRGYYDLKNNIATLSVVALHDNGEISEEEMLHTLYEDAGGRFRLFKMWFKGFSMHRRTLELASKMLRDEIDFIAKVVTTTTPSVSFDLKAHNDSLLKEAPNGYFKLDTENVEWWLEKLCRKLFAGKDATVVALQLANVIFPKSEDQGHADDNTATIKTRLELAKLQGENETKRISDLLVRRRLLMEHVHSSDDRCCISKLQKQLGKEKACIDNYQAALDLLDRSLSALREQNPLVIAAPLQRNLEEDIAKQLALVRSKRQELRSAQQQLCTAAQEVKHAFDSIRKMKSDAQTLVDALGFADARPLTVSLKNILAEIGAALTLLKRGKEKQYPIAKKELSNASQRVESWLQELGQGTTQFEWKVFQKMKEQGSQTQGRARTVAREIADVLNTLSELQLPPVKLRTDEDRLFHQKLARKLDAIRLAVTKMSDQISSRNPPDVDSKLRALRESAEGARKQTKKPGCSCIFHKNCHELLGRLVPKLLSTKSPLADAVKLSQFKIPYDGLNPALSNLVNELTPPSNKKAQLTQTINRQQQQRLQQWLRKLCAVVELIVDKPDSWFEGLHADNMRQIELWHMLNALKQLGDVLPAPPR